VKLTLLGTGAPLSPTRATLGLLLEAPGCDPLLIDSCGGFELARRLHRHGTPFAEVGDVLLSHRHGDHIGGVMALALAVSPLRLHGSADTLDAAEALLRLCYPHVTDPGARRRSLHPLEGGERTRIAGFEVEAFVVEHRVPTLALRITHNGAVLAYSADSLPCDALVDAAKGADLFVCDALCADADNPDAAHTLMHPTAGDAARMASEAGAKRLALVHLARYADEGTMLTEAHTHFAGEVLIPDDGDTLEIAATP
jgi:ribonuclease BN (tRNA processing enzyme)